MSKPSEEQLVYAGILDKGMKIGLALLVITFLVYISGVLAPVVPVDDLPKYWAMPVKDYLKATNIHPGWSWLHRVDKGDFLNFIPIALLSGVTIVCYLSIMPIFKRRGDKAYLTLVILEVLVLVLAASGVLKSGH